MAENTSIPTLTLDPNGAQVAAQAVSLEEEIQQAAETSDYSTILRDKTSQFNNKVLNNGVYNALRNNAKIKDNRADFY